MKENTLDNELKRIHTELTFLWKDYNFRVTYFTRDYGFYGKGFIIALENDILKLVFEKESPSSTQGAAKYVGRKQAPVVPPNHSYFAEYGWYPLTGLIYWLSGIQYESDKDVDKDLENLSQYLKLHMDKLLDLFKSPDEFDKKLEYYRNLHKEDQITVDKIREERARLKALGQDWSLEAAIASLRGGKK